MSWTPRTIPVGTRYGRLTVTIQRNPGEKFVHVRCNCGTEKTVRLGDLGRDTQSCGCLQRELTIQRSTRHGYSGTSLYMTWGDMLNRCTNATHPRWSSYGGRGITVCDRWRDFVNFLADMGDRPEGLTLDRIDNDGNYEPGNCRWADLSTQAKNRRPSAYAGSAHDPVSGRFLPKGRAA